MADQDLDAVLGAAREYERTLAAGDGAAALSYFDAAPGTSRFGPDGSQLDVAAVARLRTSAPATAPAEWRHESARPLGPDHVLHLALLERGGAMIQRTQVWHRTDDGWRIAHAHVSALRPEVEE
jgi:amidase